MFENLRLIVSVYLMNSFAVLTQSPNEISQDVQKSHFFLILSFWLLEFDALVILRMGVGFESIVVTGRELLSEILVLVCVNLDLLFA
jgi:hypothetical protein